MYRGKYHLFYQHLPQGCEWAFGLVWGHSVSTDLVHWQHLPHAVVPTARSLDADGCFSGCATVDTDGTPILLYTGVRLRTNADAPPLPPPDCDLSLPFIEAQLFATPSNPGAQQQEGTAPGQGRAGAGRGLLPLLQRCCSSGGDGRGQWWWRWRWR